MDLYRFRVLVDDKTESFRDIEIGANATFFDMHRAILDAFNFKGQEMASFYVSDAEWQRGHEIPLMDMGMLDDGTTAPTMDHVMLGDHIEDEDQKFIYVYDFLNMWCFYVELVNTAETEQLPEFAHVVFSHGEAPEESSRNAGFDFDDIDMSAEGEALEEMDEEAGDDAGDSEDSL